MALDQLEQESLQGARWGSGAHLHTQIEAMRLAFSDTLAFCADPDHAPVPLDSLLSKQYAQQRRRDVNPDRVLPPALGLSGSGSPCVHLALAAAQRGWARAQLQCGLSAQRCSSSLGGHR